jgi:hypothetical protein
MDVQEAQKELEAFSKDANWLHDHYDELQERYPDHWVAVYNEKVVAASSDIDEMFAELKKKNVLATKAYIKYLSTEDEIWIFWAA